MNATLFSDIQRLFERTYAQVGINLEDCLIDRPRCGQLSRAAGAAARELSELARTFLRRADGHLHIGIYYSRWLIEQLERNDPRKGLNDANIRSLIAFVEEINHALHAALQFQRGVREIASEDFARNLEICMPYLGPVVGKYSDWTPLQGRGELFPEDLDKSDPWQFKNFRVV